MTHSTHATRAFSPVARLASALLFMTAQSVAAQSVVSLSPDVTIQLGLGNLVTADHAVAADNQLGIVALQNLGALPEGTDVIGFAESGATARLATFDTTTALTGGVVARPGDVALWNGTTHSIFFDADVAGVPAGVLTDAVALATNGGLILSFDTDVSLPGGLVVADEDLVRWSGTAFSLALDGSAAGIERGLDIDGVDALSTTSFLVSFETGGTVGAVSFADEDILRFASGTWSLQLDTSTLDGDWGAADLDAFQVPEPQLGSTLSASLILLAVIGAARRRDRGQDRGRRVHAPTLVVAVRTTALAALASCVLASPTFGADGIREINQTCAITGGCFTGDAAGFPVTITTGGSYQLTSNLTIASTNTDGIVVDANNVKIDLNGFAIIGPVVCGGSPTTCTATTGTGSGIERTARTDTHTTVENGTITGMGNYGVLLGDYARVNNLRVGSNRVMGIRVESGSIVSDNSVYKNGTQGIVASWTSVVSGNSVVQNSQVGIFADLFASNVGLTIIGNSTYLNGTAGIVSDTGSSVTDNTSYGNGLSGIAAFGGSIVRGNTVVGNDGGAQLSLSTNVPYSDNMISGTTTVSGGAAAPAETPATGRRPVRERAERRFLDRAIRSRMKGQRFSFVENLKMCQTGWFLPTAKGPDYLEYKYLAEQLGTVHEVGEASDHETSSSGDFRRLVCGRPRGLESNAREQWGHCIRTRGPRPRIASKRGDRVKGRRL